MKKIKDYIASFILLLITVASPAIVFSQDPLTVSRQVPDSVVLNLQKEKVFEYANDPEYWKTEEPKYFLPAYLGNIFKLLFIITIVGLLLFAIYRLAKSGNLVFSRKGDKKNIDQYKIIPENLDWDSLIFDSETKGDHRLAIRYQFLKCLQLLHDNNMISFHPEATNHQYLQMMKQNKRYNEFCFLTWVYEYVWYGEYAISHDRYNHFAGKFNSFNQSIL